MVSLLLYVGEVADNQAPRPPSRQRQRVTVSEVCVPLAEPIIDSYGLCLVLVPVSWLLQVDELSVCGRYSLQLPDPLIVHRNSKLLQWDCMVSIFSPHGRKTCIRLDPQQLHIVSNSE